MTVPSMPGDWRKSSYSANTSDCVEVRGGEDTLVRDSKNPAAGWLTVDASAWSAFLAGLK
ncbi:uncharacterized protein DUF397 [Tamaricihabitans halophyticus]|uniref:Uncharacterized protein DUF397 n=1 Tax=Tamaricihabitans halophyticus TaxID=1262583 RepID=A0A4R2R1B9_9PSEU|nr:DUF397 domain-containing protein [Tamaricihabitans halophyticus]TCP56293.1 uncharacterized protein DUF397 [Tamaricihabitans halophyticus]